LRPVTAK